MKSNKPKLWTKDFLIVSSTNFFIFLVFYLLMVTLTVFTTDHFHTSQSLAGLASSIFVLGAVAIRPITGKFLDSMDRKKMLLFAFILFLISCILYFFVNSLILLFVVRFIHGIAFGIATTAAGTIVADIIPNERRGEGTGYFAMSTNLAMAFGPFLGLLITEHLNYSFIFLAATVFSAAGFIATLFLHVPTYHFKPQQSEVKTTRVRFSDFFEKTVLPISLLVGVTGFVYSSILSFLTSYSKEIHLVGAASFFFVMFAVFLIASRPFTGRWFDQYGENSVMYPSIFLYAIGILILSQAHIGMMLLIAGALIGIGFGTFTSSTQAIAVKVAPHDRVGLATSTFYTFYDFGIGIGPFILGLMIPLLGYRGVYVTMSIVSFACLLIYYLSHGKKWSRHNRQKQEQHSL